MKFNRKKALKTLKNTTLFVLTLILIGLVSYYTIYFLFAIAPQENETRVNNTVQSVCGWARDVDTDQAYRACGVAQNESMTEYICPSENAPNSACHVEDKR